MNQDWRCKFSTPSRIDNFVAYKSGVNWRGDEFLTEQYCKELLKLVPAYKKMEVGTALHSVIENSGFTTLPAKFTHNGWNFETFADIELAMPAQREIKLKKSFNGIWLFGKVDAISSTHVHDLKVTSTVELEKYFNSWQWKVYLCMSRLDNFVYDVLHVKIDEDNHHVQIKDYHRLELYRYETMQGEVERCLVEYWETLELLKPQLTAMSHEYKLDNVLTKL